MKEDSLRGRLRKRLDEVGFTEGILADALQQPIQMVRDWLSGANKVLGVPDLIKTSVLLRVDPVYLQTGSTDAASLPLRRRVHFLNMRAVWEFATNHDLSAELIDQLIDRLTRGQGHRRSQGLWTDDFLTAEFESIFSGRARSATGSDQTCPNGGVCICGFSYLAGNDRCPWPEE